MKNDDMIRLLRRAWWRGFTVGVVVGCLMFSVATLVRLSLN